MGKTKRKNDGFHLPFWLNFGSILTPCWPHFASLLASFGLLLRVLARVPEILTNFVDFVVPRGSLWAPFWLQFRYLFRLKNSSIFQSFFRGPLAPFWLQFLLHFPSKIGSRAKIVIFWKWAFRLHESSIFEGRGRQNPSKMPPEIDQKNDAFFRWKNLWVHGTGSAVFVGFRTLPQDITGNDLSENVANCFKSRFQNFEKGNGLPKHANRRAKTSRLGLESP